MHQGETKKELQFSDGQKVLCPRLNFLRTLRSPTPWEKVSYMTFAKEEEDSSIGKSMLLLMETRLGRSISTRKTRRYAVFLRHNPAPATP